VARDLEVELRDANQKAQQSREQFVAAKKTLRNVKDRLRREKKKAAV
jgi:uncharacterized protein YPO0396